MDLERVDLFEDVKGYNIIDTSNCVAAYYKKTKEMYLGDADLIKQFFAAKVFVFTQQGKQNTEVLQKEDGIYVRRTKVNEQVGVKYELVLYNAKVYTELYETPDVRIEVVTADENRGIDVPPLNIRDYEVANIVEGLESDAGGEDYYSIEYLKAKYPLEHIEACDYVVVASMEEADRRLQKFIETPTKVKGVDTETTGTHIGMFGDDILTGVVLSCSEEESTYYPFRQDKCEFNLPRSYLSKILKAIRDQPEDVTIVAHNGKFDKQAFMKERPCYLKYSKYLKKYEDPEQLEELDEYGLRVDTDTYILSVLCDPRQIKGLHTLKGRIARLLKQFYLELTDIFKSKDNIRFNVLPPEIIKYYACPDAPNTIKLYNALIKELPKDEHKILNLESRLVEVKAINEFYGLRCDQELLIRKLENETYKVQMLGDMFREMHHTTKNINSSDVRREILYGQLRCPVVVRTDKNQPSTSKVAIAHILETGALRNYDTTRIPPDIVDLEKRTVIKGETLISNRYPSLIILQQYALATKEVGAYKRLRRMSEGGRIKFYINQVGAGSGRQTSDAHQFSDGMKELVLADSAHHYLWSADYKQVELRILAYLAQQENLIEMESDPVVDIHRAVLSLIKGKPMWAITEEERKVGKAVNFGVVYLMTEYGLVKRLYGPKYTKEELLESRKAITDFYNTLPKVKLFIEKNKEFLRRNGYIATKMGRRRLFPQLLDPTLPARKVESLIRAGNNTPVQGFGADLLKIVETNIQCYIHEHGWDKLVECDGVFLPLVRLMLSIHDEVLVSSHESIPIEEIIKMFKECMEIEIPGAPPFFSAPAMVKSWYDGKDSSYEVDLLFRDQVIAAWEKDRTSLLHVDTYLEDLNGFRSKRISDYMEKLIKVYKTVDEVAVHIQHPELTHTLIELYVPKKERKKLTHEERIHLAVERYMEGYQAEKSIEQEDNSALEAMEVTTVDTLREYVHADESGELVVEVVEDEFQEEDAQDNVVEEDDSTYWEDPCFVQFTMEDVLVDITEFGSLEKAERVNQEIAKLHSKEKYYRVLYIFRDKCIRSGLMVGYEDKEALNMIVANALKEDVV